MRVLLLGAGASIPAGYPPASKLLEEVSEKVSQSANHARARSWHCFQTYRENATGVLREVLHSSNPEIALSQLDLLLEARNQRETDWLRRHDSTQDEGSVHAFSEDPHPFHEEPPELSDVRQELEGLEDSLDHYFSEEHRLDWMERRTARRYLLEELGSLGLGDVVLTTNWDTLAERTLSEMDLWYPTDGYGVEAPIEPADPQRPKLLSTDLRSQVQVLKLHGSLGWHSLPRRNSFYLRRAGFLQFLPVQVEGEQVFVKDPREKQRPYMGWHESPVLIRPSYLKRLDSPVLQKIWRLAKEALDLATEVRVIGYSLPESDSAVRALLNPLRERLESGHASVTVMDPDCQALRRWKELLGKQVELTKKRFGTS